MLGKYYTSPEVLPLGDSVVHRKRASRSFYLASKRALDILLILAVAPASIVTITILAFLVRLDGGKAFFGQPRLGKDGKVFTLWKLRTMVPNAEQRLEEYLQQNPDARLEWDRTQKLRNDPRVTRIGWYLRRHSLDELPQIWNVFLGEMSLVGPRPMCPEQRSAYPGTAYFDMRPGLTGLWQISDRNCCSFAERALHDTHYAQIMSFGTDMRILLRTFAVVLQGTGV